MRQGDGADLLGTNDPRNASIGVIYVAPGDDRQSVLAAILTQDKLERKQIAVVLPENNKAFQRPVDFDGLKNMRRGLKAQIVFIAPGGPGPAEYARQRRFAVFSSLESYAQSLKLEAPTSRAADGGRLGLFQRKPKPADAHAKPSAPGGIEQVPTSPLPDSRPVADAQQAAAPSMPGPGEDRDLMVDRDVPAGPNVAAPGMAGLGALAADQHASSTLENADEDWYALPPPDAASPIGSSVPASSIPGQAGEEPAPTGKESDAGPGIIVFPTSSSRPKATVKFPDPSSEAAPIPVVTPAPPAPTAAPPTRRGNTGKTAAVAAGAAAMGAGAAPASRIASGGGGFPPSGSSPGGPGPGGGGVGGSPRRRRQLLAALLVVLTLLLIAGIAVAAIPGALGSLSRILPGAATTATVTITPVSKDLSNTFEILAVTSTPDPAKREVGARILTYTSPAQSTTVQSSGSIPGARATGQLTFLNNTKLDKTFPSLVLTGTSGVPVSFNGPVTVPAAPPSSVTVTGFAVNVGAAGNIQTLDISESCCASGITVKNGQFSGGQDPQAHAIVEQADIDSGANALVTSLTPGAKTALQKQVQPNEQAVSNTFQCKKSMFTANHKAGDIAPNVTVNVAITCTEEVYDQQAALSIASNLLMQQATKELGPNYALTGNVVTAVTQATVIDTTKGTVSLLVRAEGVWVYQFSNTVKQEFANHITNMSQQMALQYLMQQPGVSSVTIGISSGNTLPDAAHITINIKPVPGATGTPTASPTTVPTPVPTTPITPTPGLGGS